MQNKISKLIFTAILALPLFFFSAQISWGQECRGDIPRGTMFTYACSPEGLNGVVKYTRYDDNACSEDYGTYEWCGQDPSSGIDNDADYCCESNIYSAWCQATPCGNYSSPPGIDFARCDYTPGPPPTEVTSGQQFTVTFRLGNRGNTVWSSSAGYKLGSQSPQNNTNWGKSRIELPSSVNYGYNLSPNPRITFTAPTVATPTDVNFQWQMLIEGVKWFDTACPFATIKVNPVPSACGNGTCNAGETCSTCSADCGTCVIPPVCGDGACNGTETCSSCSGDCGACLASPDRNWREVTP